MVLVVILPLEFKSSTIFYYLLQGIKKKQSQGVLYCTEAHMSAWTYTHTSARTYTRTHTHTHTQTHTHHRHQTHMHAHTYIHTHTHTHTRLSHWLTLGLRPYGPDAPRPYRHALWAPYTQTHRYTHTEIGIFFLLKTVTIISNFFGSLKRI